LEALEEAFDLPTADSPTRRVGGEPLDGLETVEHVAPMRSIDNATEAEAVRAFDDASATASTRRGSIPTTSRTSASRSSTGSRSR